MLEMIHFNWLDISLQLLLLNVSMQLFTLHEHIMSV